MADWLRWRGVAVVVKHSDDHEGAIGEVKFWGGSIHPFPMSYVTSMKMVGWSLQQRPSQHHWAVFHDAAGGDDDTFVQVTQMAGWGLLAGWSLFLACLSLFLVGLESILDGWSLLGWLECVLNLLLNLLPEVGWLCFWLVGPPKGAFIRLIKGPHTVLSRAFSIPSSGLISSFKGLFVRPYPFKELYRVL